jgi:4-hydroxybenzoate polyprenyltransferase
MSDSISQPTQNVVFASFLGAIAAAIAAVLVLFALKFSGNLDIPPFLWFAVPPIFAGLTIYCVYRPRALKLDTQGWVGALFGTVLLGAAFFAIDVVVGSIGGHYGSFLEAGFHAGSLFGFPLTVMIFPVGTIVAIGGLVRSAVLGSARRHKRVELA